WETTWSGRRRSFFSMCSALVAMKMWARERGASSSAAAAASMSVGLVREGEGGAPRGAARAARRGAPRGGAGPLWAPLEVAGRGGGKAGLAHVGAEPLELLADRDLLV